MRLSEGQGKSVSLLTRDQEIQYRHLKSAERLFSEDPAVDVPRESADTVESNDFKNGEAGLRLKLLHGFP